MAGLQELAVAEDDGQWLAQPLDGVDHDLLSLQLSQERLAMVGVVHPDGADYRQSSEFERALGRHTSAGQEVSDREDETDDEDAQDSQW